MRLGITAYATLITGLVSLSFISCPAQSPPLIEWEHAYGGSFIERARGITQTADGGYAVIGWSQLR